MTGIKENGIKRCYRSDKRYMLLEPSLKVLFIKFGWGATLRNQRMDVNAENEYMAALFRKPCLGSKLGYSRSRNPLFRLVYALAIACLDNIHINFKALSVINLLCLTTCNRSSTFAISDSIVFTPARR